jgi:hypothetical protein
MASHQFQQNISLTSSVPASGIAHANTTTSYNISDLSYPIISMDQCLLHLEASWPCLCFITTRHGPQQKTPLLYFRPRVSRVAQQLSPRGPYKITLLYYWPRVFCGWCLAVGLCDKMFTLEFILICLKVCIDKNLNLSTNNFFNFLMCGISSHRVNCRNQYLLEAYNYFEVHIVTRHALPGNDSMNNLRYAHAAIGRML